MIIFKNIEIKDYRNIQNLRIKDLKDLNIFIGPNNCGKTHFLKFISNFSNIDFDPKRDKFFCEKCEQVRKSYSTKIRGISYPLTREDYYLRDRRKKIRGVIELNKETINQEVTGVTNQIEYILKKENKCEEADKKKIELFSKKKKNKLSSNHVSIFSHPDILQQLKKWILFCPDTRLQFYKKKTIGEYWKDKIGNLDSAQKRRIVNHLKRFIDSKIDEVERKLIQKINDRDFELEIADQGSGVRALICLMTDLVAANPKVTLIDEPELGLNPFAKQKLLIFLKEETDKSQIFLATHDSAFVNPILLDPERTSIYVFSPIYDGKEENKENPNFVKIDLNQSKQDPYTFGGYLPHPESLKPIHFYVEGTKDVSTLSNILWKYKQDISLFNKVGIYHLAGNFWKHLLYTIPITLDKSIVILDNDKKQEAKDVCEKYASANINAPEFKVCEKIDEIKKCKEIPIYCLKSGDVENADKEPEIKKEIGKIIEAILPKETR